MTWLRRLDPETTQRKGLMIFWALCRQEVMSEAQRRSLEMNVGLISYAMLNTESVRARPMLSYVQLDSIAESSERHLLVLVSDPQLMYPKLFGPRGYKFIVTASGMEYAERIASSYSDHIDPNRFMEGWLAAKHQLAGIGSSRRDRERDPNERR
jgi:hypothetical protein